MTSRATTAILRGGGARAALASASRNSAALHHLGPRLGLSLSPSLSSSDAAVSAGSRASFSTSSLSSSVGTAGPGRVGAGAGRRGLSGWRSTHTACAAPLRWQSAAAVNAPRPGIVGARVGELMGAKTGTASMCAHGAGAWMACGSRRAFSVTARYCREKKPDQDKTPSSSSAPSTAPQQPELELKGIRKVLPKLPSLASATAHENIYTVPNLLTFSRLALAPFIGYAILRDAHTWALGMFVYAGVSDLLDGWIARRWKLQTVVGSVVDPMADKILMTVLTVCLATQGALPVWLAVIILGRDVGLGIAAIYYRWISLPPPKTFTRYWDFSLPSAEVRPTTISKYNTFLQLGLMGATMVAPVITADVGVAMTGFQYLVATTTVWSGLSYVYTKDAVKILSENKEKSKDT